MNVFNKNLLIDVNIQSFMHSLVSNEFFVGCFARDKVPINELVLKPYWSCIINLDLSTEPGSHFVALLFNNNQLFLFDSLPLPINWTLLKPIIDEYKQQESRDIQFWRNTKQYQSVESNACGYFCMWFILKYHLFRPTINNIENTILSNLKPTKSLINEKRIISDFEDIIATLIRRTQMELLNCLLCTPNKM